MESFFLLSVCTPLSHDFFISFLFSSLLFSSVEDADRACSCNFLLYMPETICQARLGEERKRALKKGLKLFAARSMPFETTANIHDLQ